MNVETTLGVLVGNRGGDPKGFKAGVIIKWEY